MTRDELIESAQALKQPERSVSDEYERKKYILVSRVIENLQQRKDINRLVGEGNVPMMEDNIHNMARFMGSIFIQYDAAVFVETILWVFRTYRSHGFQLAFWSAHLNIWIGTIHSELSKNANLELYPFYDWIQIHIPQFTTLTDSAVSEVKDS